MSAYGSSRQLRRRRRRDRLGDLGPVDYDEVEVARRLYEQGAPTPASHRGRQEWQWAADAASVCLSIDAARQFGLVTGGPGVNVERCVEILEQAYRRYEILPSPDAVERFLPAFMAGDADPHPSN